MIREGLPCKLVLIYHIQRMSRIIRAFSTDAHLQKVGENLVLGVEESQHLSRVLRLESGRRIEVLDGQGRILSMQCDQISYRQVSGQIIEEQSVLPSQPRFQIAVALIKAGRWDGIIRPLTELGVSRITPLHTERTDFPRNSVRWEPRLKKWNRSAIEACKQSGNPWLPQIDSPMTFEEYLSEELERDMFLASLRPSALTLNISASSTLISLLIGPEGGWTDGEETLAIKRGVSLFSIGTNVLRAETAASSALAVAKAKILD